MTSSSANIAWAVAAGAAATLAGALAFQHIGGLAPCELCYLQRYPYWGAIPLAAAAAFAPGRLAAALLAGACLCLLATAGVAAFHVGVEQHWWQGLASCGGTQGPAANLDELRARLLAAPIVRCDEPAWTLAGLSMAAYNFLIAAGLAGLAAFAAFRRMDETQ